jgi:8-hydroxy-5-deazaflavin:NADPH oxidoreductase
VTLDFQTFDSLTVPADSSAAAEAAAALPHSAVLKAFNTNFAATLAACTTGEASATVLIAGDNTLWGSRPRPLWVTWASPRPAHTR